MSRVATNRPAPIVPSRSAPASVAPDESNDRLVTDINNQVDALWQALNAALARIDALERRQR